MKEAPHKRGHNTLFQFPEFLKQENNIWGSIQKDGCLFGISGKGHEGE